MPQVSPSWWAVGLGSEQAGWQAPANLGSCLLRSYFVQKLGQDQGTPDHPPEEAQREDSCEAPHSGAACVTQAFGPGREGRKEIFPSLS